MEHPTTPDTRKLLQQTVAVDGFLYVLFVVENETGNNGTEQRRRRHLDAVGRLQPVEHTLQVGVYVHRGKLGVAQLVLLSQVQEHLPAVRGVALLQRVLAGKLLSLGFWQLLGSRSRAVLLVGRCCRLGVEGRLVVHRLHRRAVVLTPHSAIKFTREGRASAVAVQSSQVAELCEGTGIAAAKVLDHSPSRVSMELLPGSTLHDLAGQAMPGWRRFADVWPSLITRFVGLPEHTGADEANVLWQWFQHIEGHRALPQLDRLGNATAQACQQLASGDNGSRVLVHRDLHDKQLMWDGTTLGLLDLDTATRGEAALDLGNLWAHIELRHVQGRLTRQDRDRILDLLGEVVAAAPTTLRRVVTHHRAARLRLAYVYAFRPQSASWLPHWVEETLRSSSPVNFDRRSA